MYSRILLASDGSDDASRAAETAARLAKLFHARLHVLHVFPLLPSEAAPREISPFKDSARIAREVVCHWAEKSEHVVECRVEKVLAGGETPYTFHQENGDPAAVIVEVAGREAFDLIVIGCRGLGPALRTRLGSVSEWVTHNAPCPVLVVRDKELSRQTNEKTEENN